MASAPSPDVLDEPDSARGVGGVATRGVGVGSAVATGGLVVAVGAGGSVACVVDGVSTSRAADSTVPAAPSPAASSSSAALTASCASSPASSAATAASCVVGVVVARGADGMVEGAMNRSRCTASIAPSGGSAVAMPIATTRRAAAAAEYQGCWRTVSTPPRSNRKRGVSCSPSRLSSRSQRSSGAWRSSASSAKWSRRRRSISGSGESLRIIAGNLHDAGLLQQVAHLAECAMES